MVINDTAEIPGLRKWNNQGYILIGLIGNFKLSAFNTSLNWIAQTTTCPTLYLSNLLNCIVFSDAGFL